LTIRTLTLAVVLFAAVAAAAESTYTVRRGDTLRKISKRFGVSQDALLSANGLEKSSELKRGQTLTIPGSQTSSKSLGKKIGTAEVVIDNAIPHAGPFNGAKSLDPLALGESFRALDKKPGWIDLELPSGEGWVPSSLVKFTPNPTDVVTAPKPVAVAVAKTPAAKKELKKVAIAQAIRHAADSGNPLLTKALAYQGVRYRWGGTSRSSGVDCSGFTTSVFKTQGIKLPRTALEQSHIGDGVTKGDLKPGDLVFFRTSRSYRVNHVGIYVGEGKFIHAATGAGHVMVSSLDEKYYLRCYATARRVADVQTASRAAAASKAATDEEVGQ